MQQITTSSWNRHSSDPHSPQDLAGAGAKSTKQLDLISLGQGPQFRWTDIWRAPLHDLPIRDELLYQYLRLSADMKVLEVGPGAGFTAFRLARQVGELTLLDISADAIAELKRKLKGFSNLKFVCADASSPGLSNLFPGRFDAVYALAVLEAIRDPRTFFRNVAAMLCPGGRLLIQLPNYLPPRNPGITYFRTRMELEKMLQAAPFAAWELYSLKLRYVPSLIYRNLHERPLQYLRRVRQTNDLERPQVFDATWAFQNRSRMENYKVLIHLAWTSMFAGIRLAGDCFQATRLQDDIFNNNLLLLARR